MIKHTVIVAAVLVLALGVLGLGHPNKPASIAGSWQVDTRHSDAKLITDATTDYGKTKLNVALGYARLEGVARFDDADVTRSKVDLHIYPATSMSPSIGEDGKFLTRWLENLSNHTLLCFHSKEVHRLPDGRLQATGDLIVVRVDRNVDATPSEAYSGPVYGPPVLHRVSREATFTFDPPTDGESAQKDGGIQLSGSTKVIREDFPQLVKTVVNTYWPLVVQDKNCQTADASEAYSGSRCTGTFLETQGMPVEPHAANGEDVGTSQNFNEVVGERLTINVNMRLRPNAAGEHAMGGN
jgi:polyisoprenoid-binding protein YceI